MMYLRPSVYGTGRRHIRKGTTRSYFYILPEINGYVHVHHNDTRHPYAKVDEEIPWKYQRENERIRSKFLGPFTREEKGPTYRINEVDNFRAVVTSNDKVYLFYKKRYKSNNVGSGGSVPVEGSVACAACASIDDKGVVGEFTKVWEDSIRPRVYEAFNKGVGLSGEIPFGGTRGEYRSWIVPGMDVSPSMVGALAEQEFNFVRTADDDAPYDNFHVFLTAQSATSTKIYAPDKRLALLEQCFTPSAARELRRVSRFSINIPNFLNTLLISGRQECRRNDNEITIYNNTGEGSYNAHINIKEDGSLDFDSLRLEYAGGLDRVLRYVKIKNKLGGQDKLYGFIARIKDYRIGEIDNSYYGYRYSRRAKLSIVILCRDVNSDGSFLKWKVCGERIVENDLPHGRYYPEELESIDFENYLFRGEQVPIFPLAVTANRLYLVFGYNDSYTYNRYKQVSCVIKDDASIGEIDVCDVPLLEGDFSENTHIHDSFMTSSRIYCVLTSSSETVEIDGEEKLNINLMWAPLYDEGAPGQNITAHVDYVLPYPQIQGAGGVNRKNTAHGDYVLPYPQIYGAGRVNHVNTANVDYVLPYPQIYGAGRVNRKNTAHGLYILPYPSIRAAGRIDDDWILRFKREEVL